MNLLLQFLKFLISLLESKPIEKKEDIKQVNQEVFKEIKDTPSLLGLPKVEVDSKIESLVKEPVSQPTIIQRFLNPIQYVQDSKFKVNQVVLHHTAGGSADSTIRYWESNKERVCTHFLIDRDGTIYQCIPLEKAYGYHLYVASPGNRIDRKFRQLGSQYDRQSIGIELCNYGYVTFKDGKFVNYIGKLIHHQNVTKLNHSYKGYFYWESYTPKQIDALEKLLLFLLEQYPALKEGLYNDYSLIGEIDMNALNMKPGIYGHGAYRTDKFDVYPNPELIKMLNQLHTKI